MTIHPAHCRTCEAPIVWAEFKASGTRVPLDAEPIPDGNLVIIARRPDGTAVVVLAEHPNDGQLDLEAAAVPRWVTHFKTCPDATEWRR